MSKTKGTSDRIIADIVKEFPNELISQDNKSIFCVVCDKEINHQTLFLVKQHLNGKKT